MAQSFLSDSDTIKYNGENYELFSPIPMAFGRDTVFPEIWFRTLNVDGDNKRILRLFGTRDTTNFPLPNAVNNYTRTTCYSLRVDKHRYLWFEDNFGTTVIDIDFKKAVKVKIREKKLTQIAPTGAPIGVKKSMTEKEIKQQLGLSKKSKMIILDSLSFRM